MKKFTLLLTISVVLIAGCDKGSVPGGGGSNPPPANNDPKITSFVVTPVTNVYFSGLVAPSALTVTWATTYAASAKLNGAAVNLSGSNSLVLTFVRDTILRLVIFDALGNQKAEQSIRITATIDPIFEKLSGREGKSYRLTAATGQTCQTCPPFSIMTNCLLDDVFTFYPNCTNQTSYGTDPACATGLSSIYSYWFNSATMLFNTIGTIPPQPDKTVEFTSVNTMTMSYTYNNVIYSLYYQSF
jgi:hypothetical protein